MLYTIENLAGGNRRSFRWSAAKGLSLAALRHAVDCAVCGSPVFGGPAGELASADYDELYGLYLSGECGEEVEAIFQGC